MSLDGRGVDQRSHQRRRRRADRRCAPARRPATRRSMTRRRSPRARSAGACVVQRWPAVPTAPNTTARTASSRSASSTHDDRVVAAQLEQRAAEPRAPPSARPARPTRVEPVDDDRAAGADRRACARRRRVVADDQLEHAVGRPRSSATTRSTMRCTASAVSGVLGDGFQTTVSPHDRREHRVPRPHRDGEIERGDDADRRRADATARTCGGCGRSECIVRP